MATPYGPAENSAILNTGPSRTLLQQLLEEISGASPTPTVRNGSTSQAPGSTQSWTASQNHSPSAWASGSCIAQDARDKLRAADEAHQRRSVHETADNAPNLQTTMLHLDALALQTQNATSDEYGNRPVFTASLTPDPVRHPHDYTQCMTKGNSSSTILGLSPASQGHPNTPFQPYEPLFSSPSRPLSPLIFSDVDFESSSLSPQTETTISPTEAPISGATVHTAEESWALIDRQNMNSSKRIHFSDDSTPEASPKKKRTMTLPEIRSEAFSKMAINAPHFFVDLGRDDRCVLRDETFTERLPTPRMSFGIATTDALPELSSFRPTAANPQGQPVRTPPSQKMTHTSTSLTRSPSPTAPETPAWMRPMHLVDTGGKSIYLNVHDDGPIRHALCLYCFRTHGSFRKVHKYGYETCGRTEVLDSHYWESDTWPVESSDDSTSSDC
ncbi:hypothetical protein ST47_g7486 [Ascochyta rabiei]|uniref:Uncharacterized protein n=1 Tax=Didymella rabiei TaxID=5454 RepID=A0A163ATH3_DIDRA|nr:hypothetical protein ST47_g7486 [Ascochyta rabiei]